MSKKIKMQIKRSMPYFMILSLIMSSTVIGLVFNFNTSTQKLVTNLFYPEAQAQNDTATTTVTVKNAPPDIIIQPSELFASGQGSTSTTPVNIGASIGFSITASDMESNSYYLLVCANGSAPTPGAGGSAPECSGGASNRLCVSGLFADDAEATCTYNSVSGAPETKDWYAFVCDNHATESDCSAYSQGSAVGVNATSSPMYVNHAPVFASGATTVNNQPAGDNPFTFTATTTDTDLLGGPDVIQYDVCSTNSWATTTGCTATTICSATSTISGGTAVVSCQATTTIPTVDQAYHYWGFVKDWHELAASSGNAVDRTYTVINTAPVVSSVVLVGGDITVNMKNSAEKTVTITGTISDNNSCADLTSATSSVFLSSVAGLENCAADDDDCYQIPAVSCVQDGGTCSGVTDLSANYTCTVDMAFNSTPTDPSANNSNAANNWLAGMKAIDNNSASHIATSASPVELITVSALDIVELSIPYGAVKGGQDTGAYNATTTIVNYGNSPLNSGVSGTDMGPIAIINQKYDLTPNVYTSLTNNASAVNTTVDIVAPKPNTDALNIEDSIYWGIFIPGGTASGNYSGTNSFVAELDGSIAW